MLYLNCMFIANKKIFVFHNNFKTRCSSKDDKNKKDTTKLIKKEENIDKNKDTNVNQENKWYKKKETKIFGVSILLILIISLVYFTKK